VTTATTPISQIHDLLTRFVQLISEGTSKLASVPSGGAGAAAPAAGGAEAAAPAAEEKKEEEKEESDEDMGFGLFD
jgi:large subunit ribosomal protein LP2